MTSDALRPRKWSKDAVIADAKKYRWKREWQQASASAYAAAHRRGWLDEACRHMAVRWEAKWDRAAVIASARKYGGRAEWKSGALGAYKAALRHGWLAEATAHMAKKRRDWDLHSLQASARPYTSRSAWKEADGAAYKAARDHGLLDRVCAHMARAYKPAGWWTKERILDSARKHLSVPAWDAAATTAVQRARQRGWIDEAIAHMNAVPMPIGPATIHEFLLSHRVPYKSEYRFRSHAVVAKMPFDFYLPERKLLIEFHGKQHRDGWSSDPASRELIQRNDLIKREWAHREGFAYVEICAWIDRTQDQVRVRVARALGGDLPSSRQLTAAERRKIWSGLAFEEDAILADAAQYQTRAAWMRASPNAYRFALRHGLANGATRHMAYVTEHGKWTRETVIASARAFSSLAQWRKTEPSAYVISNRLGCFAEATQHMTRAKQPNGYWTLERVLASARGSKTFAMWRATEPSAASSARRNGWTNEVRATMGLKSRR